MSRFVFNRLKKNRESQIRQKLSILLMSAQLKKKDQQDATKILNAFRKRSQKAISSTKISEWI